MLLDGTKNNENKQKVWLVVFHKRAQFLRYAASVSLRWKTEEILGDLRLWARFKFVGGRGGVLF
jgi:hypothetical protein